MAKQLALAPPEGSADQSAPFIDESVEHVGVTRLRAFNSHTLREIRGALVIQDGDEPLAVLLPYATFLAMQRSLINTSEQLRAALARGPEARGASNERDSDGR